MINCIENLSNEIFYEIFDYLDIYHIYIAFSNLNHHFDNLIINSSFSMKIEISIITLIDSNYKEFIKSNKHHIISLDFNHQISFDDIMKLFTFDSLFIRLESLIFNQISTSELAILLFYLKSLPKLSSLSIYINECDQDIDYIYQMIFNLSLKYFRIAILGYPQLDIILPIVAQDQYSSIKYLIIYHRCTFNELINIISYTPRLSYLDCSNIIESDEDFKRKLEIKLNNLIYLGVTLNGIEFDEFEEFLVKLCSNLECLNVKMINSIDDSYLNANRWERLITQNIPSLIKFIFRYDDIIDENFNIGCNHLLLNCFTSSFWINRKWIFKVLAHNNKLTYIIHPYKETWIDHQEYLPINQNPKKNVVHSSNSYFPTTELCVYDGFLIENDESLINELKPIFNILQITYLDIDCYKMSVSMVIVILNSLQNLKSMRISDSPFYLDIDLNIQDMINFSVFLYHNKIKKLTLRNVFELKQIDFIFHHFSHLQFFGLQQVQNNNLKSIVQYILEKINNNNIFYPMTICVFCDDAKYDAVEKLYQMINSKNLLKNYTIHRRYNRFYVQWK